MPKYRKNADGYYRATVMIGRTESGGERRKTVRAKSVKELELKLSDAKLQFNRGFDFDAEKCTVAQWSERWLKLYKDPAVGAKERKNARSLLSVHILPRIGNLPLGDVKPFMLQEIMNLQAGKSKSNTTKIRGALKQMFSKAKQGGLILDSPAEFLEMPKTTTKRRRSLTPEERSAVLKVCVTHRAGLWVMFLLLCGLRRGETVPLTWGDIDFEAGMLNVDKAVEFVSVDEDDKIVHNAANEKDAKTECGRRTIPIPPPLMYRLLHERRRDCDLIFTPARSEKMLTETNCARLWKSFYRELDIEMGAVLYRNAIVKTSLKDGITPHALRHTFATDLYEMGVDLKTAQILCGHADIKTTANIYTHMRKDMLDAAREKMEAYYNAEQEPPLVKKRKLEVM